MTDLKQKLHEDRALRDVAKQLVSNDIDNLRGDLEQKSLARRFSQRMKEGAEGAAEESRQFVEDNPGRVASVAGLGLGLLLLWLFRDAISRFVDDLLAPLAELAPDTEKTEQLEEHEAATARSSSQTENSDPGETDDHFN